MRALRFGAVALLLLAAAWWWSQRGTAVRPVERVSEDLPKAPQVVSQRSAGRAAEPPDPAWLAAARDVMTDEREERCGPYLMLTDSRDPRIGGVCERIGAALDGEYRNLYGIEPVGEPKGAVLVFSRAAEFRAFASEVGHVRVGYAGFSRATRGVVALSSDGLAAVEMAPTLAHELTHLVNRRALGSDLPRWLAEGLADGIGDTAGAGGLGVLEGFVGVEAQRRRLLEAYGADRVPRIERLVALERSDFDREVVSYDYEQSALLVRFLLLDPELAPKLRSLLGRLASGERYEPQMLTDELALDGESLEVRFRSWFGGAG
ncbi:MAG: hypothetical protein OES47_11385, partial [Acidobacteriota bacterium]|nr:hypothetical protein [Acidobacteriota bacterium]